MNVVIQFLFENIAVRGTICQIDSAWRHIHKVHPLPSSVKTLMGEAIAGSLLVSGQLKNLQHTSLQIRGGKFLPLLVSDVHKGKIRAMAQIQQDADMPIDANFSELINGAVLALVMTPEEGEQYQGIVDTSASSLSGAMKDFFEQSEQVKSWLRLYSDDNSCTGLLLQKMPDTEEAMCTDDDWQRLNFISDTLKNKEMQTLTPIEILQRLFAEDSVRLVREQPLVSECQCSREKLEKALFSIGEIACKELLADRSTIDSKCDFCQKNYSFDRDQIHKIFYSL